MPGDGQKGSTEDETCRSPEHAGHGATPAVEPDDVLQSSHAREEKKGGGITRTGKKFTFWLHEDETEALRRAAFEQRRKQSEIIREGLRRLVGIED